MRPYVPALLAMTAASGGATDAPSDPTSGTLEISTETSGQVPTSGLLDLWGISGSAVYAVGLDHSALRRGGLDRDSRRAATSCRSPGKLAHDRFAAGRSGTILRDTAGPSGSTAG